LEKAIGYWKAASQVITKESFPQDWARLKNNLANAYLYRRKGEKGNNLKQAISAYQEALSFYDREQYPEKYASIQKNLGVAYLQY
jgi:tetratricopeptide (TPR) repeat protein